MTDSSRFVGIDVSKHHLDIAILPATIFRVTNDAAGWNDLVDRLDRTTAPCVVLEATGPYHVGVTLALAAAGMPPAVINPARTHAFIRSEGQQTKTDRTDARLLARFAQQKQPSPSLVPCENARHLTDLVSCRDDLTGMLVMEKNRLTVATAVTRGHHQTIIAQLTAERRLVETEIAALIAADPGLAARDALLQSAPGIGVVLSPVLLAGLPELGQFPASGLAALAGVAPHIQQSGLNPGTAHLRGGRVAIRKALYQVAVTATRKPGPMREHYQQLRGRGKPHKVALIACARRMLGILNAMLRDGVTWPDTKVAQGAFLPQTA